MIRICTICARGGSKGVPGKNIAMIQGRPLIAWSIEQARQSGLFSTIAVSSDSDVILSAAERAGADHLIHRPAEMATDIAPKVVVIRHALERASLMAQLSPDVLVDLDVTSPLRLPEDIMGAVKLLEETGCSNVITGSPARRSPYFNLVEARADGSVSLSKPGTGIIRRQDAPRAYDMNASIYVWDVPRFLAAPAIFNNDTRLFEMPEERSIDIDSGLDLEFVTYILGKRLQGLSN
ncbi:MAG: acylneuraminate cytidylyltransferase family protein [Candidatus Devosia symbiotica]|nr:acylneuraminate cytidylyltransferase family protein [Candidatus Devosia symbiotica]